MKKSKFVYLRIFLSDKADIGISAQITALGNVRGSFNRCFQGLVIRWGIYDSGTSLGVHSATRAKDINAGGQ